MEVQEMSTSGSETDDEDQYTVDRAVDGDASESVAVNGNADNVHDSTVTKKRLVLTRRERNEGLRNSLTAAVDPAAFEDEELNGGEWRPFIDKLVRADVDDAATLADKVGVSRAAVKAIRLNKVDLPALLAADAEFLTKIGVGSDDQGVLLKCLHSANREKWEPRSVIAPPSHIVEDPSPFTLPDMCSMLSNSTLHLNCIESSLIDAERLVHQYRKDKLLKTLGYQDVQNVKQLKILIAMMKSSATALSVRLDGLKLALEGKEARVVKSSVSGVKYGAFALFGVSALATAAFLIVRQRH